MFDSFDDYKSRNNWDKYREGPTGHNCPHCGHTMHQYECWMQPFLMKTYCPNDKCPSIAIKNAEFNEREKERLAPLIKIRQDKVREKEPDAHFVREKDDFIIYADKTNTKVLGKTSICNYNFSPAHYEDQAWFEAQKATGTNT